MFTLLVSLCLFQHPGTSLDTRQISFHNVEPVKALDIPGVRDIIQDADGFLWIATQNGLFRYDGHRAKPYYSDDTRDDALPNNFVRVLHLTRNGQLLLGTPSGLCRYIPDRDGFEPWSQEPLAGQAVYSMVEDERGRLWVGTRHGVYCLPADQDTHHWNAPVIHYLETPIVTALTIWRDTLVIGTRAGLQFRDPDTMAAVTVAGIPLDQRVLFIEAVDDELWISFRNELHHRQRSGQWRVFTVEFIKGVLPFKNGTLLCGGSRYFLDHAGNMQSLTDPLDQFDTAYSLFLDRGGVLWFANFQGGVRKINLQALNFQWHVPDYGVWTIHEDPGQTRWFGTNRNGVIRQDLRTGESRHITADPERDDSLLVNRVTTIHRDTHQRLWVGSLQGLQLYHPAGDRFRHFVHDSEQPNSLSENSVWHVADAADGGLWIGTAYGGLNHLSPDLNHFQALRHDPQTEQGLSSDFVRFICRIDEDTLWLATNEGVNVLDEPSRRIVNTYNHQPGQANSLSDRYVSAILKDSRGTIWVSTFVNGFQKYDAERDRFIRYGPKHGLPDPCVYGLLEDEQGNLWLSTNQGISRFEPDSEQFTNYFQVDGLLDREHNQGAFFKNRDGTLFFGGVHGVTSFSPTVISLPKATPDPILTNLRLFNENVDFRETNPAQLDRPIYRTESVTLSYRDATVGFEFSSLTFADPDNLMFAYSLKGHDDRWIQTDGDQRTATYSRLQPGMYQFWAKANDRRQSWSEPVNLLQLRVLPPFWQTWWFRVAICLLIAGLLWVIHRIRLHYVLGLEQLRTKIAQDIHDEVGSTVTQIATQAQFLGYQQSLPEKVSRKLANISAQSQELVSGFGDIIWILDRKNDSGESLVIRLKHLALKLFEDTEIRHQFQVTQAVEQLRLDTERRHEIYLIVKEALHNILKHAQARTVNIALERQGKRLLVTVKDDGKGLARDKGSGHGLDNMAMRAKRLNGELKLNNDHGCRLALHVPL